MQKRFVGLIAVAVSLMSFPALAGEKTVVVRYVGKETQAHQLRADQIPANANGIRVGHKRYAIASNGTTNVMTTGARPEWVSMGRGQGTKHLGWLPKQPKKP